jgi:crotonobetainyl-CoA:carnitine CoA-transferase CaiB-like acyl-CoA transferase
MNGHRDNEGPGAGGQGAEGLTPAPGPPPLNVGDGPLSDLKVVEIGGFFSAPYCAKLLADLGADVVKVEPPGAGDESRRRGPFPDDRPHPERSGLFLYLNTNKRGITLDLATATGREILGKLLAWADVLVENLGPRRSGEVGLDPASVAAVNPRLIVTSISPFGQTGPKRCDLASDLVSFHSSGYGMTIGGSVDDPYQVAPLKGAEYQADFVAGINAAFATLAGVFARKRQGAGQQVDVSEQEAMVPFVFGEVARYTSDGKVHSRRSADNPATGVVAILPTNDGFVAISPREEHLWTRWLEVMGDPSWGQDERFKDRASRIRNWAELELLLAEWTRQHGTEEIFRAAQAARVPSFPVSTVENIFASAQLAARGFFQEIPHPAAGTYRYPSAPYHFSRVGWQLRRPAPLLGEHNDEIFGTLLGYGPSEIVKLRQAGIT